MCKNEEPEGIRKYVQTNTEIFIHLTVRMMMGFEFKEVMNQTPSILGLGCGLDVRIAAEAETVPSLRGSNQL